MTLEKYNKKRKFSKTNEPPGKAVAKSKNRFVIQEHQASHLHYDFRLELPAETESRDIVLKSWAVPKGVPEEKGIKRLAVAVEDHPVGYLDFQGDIPAGEYGAGHVDIFDRGKFKLVRRDKKILEVVLAGKKCRGLYVMVNTQGKNWLLFKK